MDGRTSGARRVWLEVNGTRQAMILEGEAPGRPVMLFLHGGPGMPEHWLTRRYPTGLAGVATVAWWEQRGAGLSYRAGIPFDELTVDQLVADTLVVTDHLRDRLGVEQVLLLGHSWGSFLGLLTVAREPTPFRAYVGVAQITHQIRSEARAHDDMLRRYRELGDTRMVRRLASAPVDETTIPLPPSYLAVRDRAMHRLGVGTTRDMRSVVTGLFLPSWRSPDHTVRETIDLWRGKVASRRSPLWDEVLRTDLFTEVPRIDVPAYFLHGIHDRTADPELARQYALALEAPLTGFYTFHRSAHSPVFEEPERVVRILREDVLTGRTTLADHGLAASSRS